MKPANSQANGQSIARPGISLFGKCVFFIGVVNGSSVVSAQSGEGYTLSRVSVSGSGFSGVTGGDYVMSGTVGQHDVSELSGGDYALSGGFWIAPVSAPSAPAAEPTPIAKNRYVSFIVPSDGAAADTAIRVQLFSLHHPAGPPNAPNFSAFEGQYRYLNAIRDGGNNPVFDCPDSAASATSYKCAKLGCAPEYRDWAGIFGGDVVHVTGGSVVPSSQYALSQLAASCAGNESNCAAASAELMVSTERWGNVDNIPPGGTPNALDISRVVDKVKDAAGAFIEPRCQLREASPNPYAAAVNAQDIGRIVDAVKGQPYPFTINVCP